MLVRCMMGNVGFKVSVHRRRLVAKKTEFNSKRSNFDDCFLCFSLRSEVMKEEFLISKFTVLRL